MRHIALEWDDREARIAVANCRGGNVRLEHALTATLPSEGEASAETIGRELGKLLEDARATKGEAIVVLDRASIELRRMRLPPAPDEELPDMARFQAVREFTNYNEDWLLDFEVLSSDESGIWVLAAVMSPDTLKFSRKVAEAAGLTLGHLLLRPFAAASLFESSPLYGESNTPLLIDSGSDDADLTALSDDRVVFTRTVKIAASSEDSAMLATALAGEIRRTMVAAQNQQSGYKVGQIIICDDPTNGKPIAERIGEQLGITVRILDPLEVVDATSLSSKPSDPGRYASLFGALLEESREERHAIDFLDPKKRPPPPDKRREQILGVATAAILILAVVGGVWWTLWSYDQQIAEINKQIRDNQELLEAYAEKEKELNEIREFVERDIVWLDELSRVSVAAPEPEDAIATTFRANLLASGVGRITLEGTVSDPSLIDDFESRMRDEAHRVSGKGGTFDEQGTLPWRFNETITIDPLKIGLPEPEQEGAGE